MDSLSNLARLNKKDRKRIAQKFIKRTRKDVSYLLKPRPFFLTTKLWVLIISKFLYLDRNNLEKICLISSSKTNKAK